MKIIGEVIKIECSFSELKSGKVANEIVKLFQGHDEKQVTEQIMFQYLLEKDEAEDDSNSILVSIILGCNENDEDCMVKLEIS